LLAAGVQHDGEAELTTAIARRAIAVHGTRPSRLVHRRVHRRPGHSHRRSSQSKRHQVERGLDRGAAAHIPPGGTVRRAPPVLPDRNALQSTVVVDGTHAGLAHGRHIFTLEQCLVYASEGLRVLPGDLLMMDGGRLPATGLFTAAAGSPRATPPRSPSPASANRVTPLSPKTLAVAPLGTPLSDPSTSR
jgi:hypothetical protein